MGDQLRDHRVVGDPDLVAFIDTGIDANVARQSQARDASGLREERARILSVKTNLDRVPN